MPMNANSNRLSRDLLGLFLLFIGMLLLLSLGTHSPDDPSLTHIAGGGKAIGNKAGLFGAYASGFLADMLGVGAYAAPCVFLVAGSRRVMGASPWPWWRWFGLGILTSCAVIAGEAWKLAIRAIAEGGLLGHALLRFFSAYLGTVGATLFWLFLFCFAVQLVSGGALAGLLRDCARNLCAFLRDAAERRRETAVRETALAGETLRDAARKMPGETPAEIVAPVLAGNEEEQAGPMFRFSGEETAEPALGESGVVPAGDILPGAAGLARNGANLDFLGAEQGDDVDPPWVRDLEEDKVAELALRGPRNRESSAPAASGTTGVPASHTAPNASLPSVNGPPIDIREAVTTVPAADAEASRRKRVALPPFSLLRTVASATEKTPREALEAKGRTLMTCLSDFGIQGELVRIAPGPVVTMFEVRPAAGVRVARIESLSDDLSLALKAVAVRVQAPIPGTDAVGIEIPNDIREIVSLKELFCSKAFAESDSLLSMALGKDIQGAPAMADLTRMPHLLVAGATGAGKSVCLNSILLSFLYKARPEEVKLLLVDPKRVEMAVYADLPHLVHPVVTEMELAKNALNWAVNEMSDRYNKLALLGVRNIAAYNEKLREVDKTKQPDWADLEPMPYLVIIIDELADLMMTAAKEVEGYIMRLAQLARAAGIHLILATQRPSVDVVTGLIKANFPCRISFQVTSKHDSRTILDTVGAEQLLGKGDMLYKPAGGKFRRLHGAFVSDEDVAAVTDYWRSRQKPSYSIDFSDWGSDGASVNGGGGGTDDVVSDPMYAEAVNFVREQGKASISLIQRRFRIGFNRAARFVEQMEQDGIIGPADGSKPRMVR
ncbi:MAG: DNA translocase FtsK 4TM domain-containing protein [Deltaproteobacteria bacterium]|jgi:S-DNA-T family DNA segregation ATPase FtsK/SpoIIIE|nr:DNA translocase FtsK 4TM domain-containing protein [Deltaproteobacteria bacterium]